ncbi:MAG: hypothetical protein Q9218_002100 [Villophora microphyllina]
MKQGGPPVRLLLNSGVFPHGTFVPNPEDSELREMKMHPRSNVAHWQVDVIVDREVDDWSRAVTTIMVDPQDEVTLLRKLEREAYGMSQVFEYISDSFPKLCRLALFLPAALYTSFDQEFIDGVLSGGPSVWEVQHRGDERSVPQVPATFQEPGNAEDEGDDGEDDKGEDEDEDQEKHYA